MTTTEMNTQTDYYAKSDSTSFPTAEKLAYYVEADGILNGLIIQQQENRGETEPAAVTTVAGQSAYAAPSRNHHINWLKISYDGTNFVAARYISEEDLILWFGANYESALTAWSAAYPIYFRKNTNFYVYPAPTASQAGASRLKYSVENLPADLTGGSTPALVPVNFHYLHCAYAALSFLDEDDPLWKKAKRKWDEGVPLMLETIYPNAKQREIISGVPEEEDDWRLNGLFPSGVPNISGSNVNYADNETPSGTVGGGNTVFTLANTPEDGSLQLYRNGVLQVLNVNYTLVGVTITFTSAPGTGNIIRAFYRY